MPIATIAALTFAVATAQHTHSHGSANLAVGVEDSGAFQIEFTSPAHDIYGFEHEPRNEEQRAAVTTAQAHLSNIEDIILIEGGRCSISAVNIEGEDGHGGHGDVHVVYTGRCNTPDDITGISTRMFEHFSRLHDIDGIFISSQQQSAFELTDHRAFAALN